MITDHTDFKEYIIKTMNEPGAMDCVTDPEELTEEDVEERCQALEILTVLNCDRDIDR